MDPGRAPGRDVIGGYLERVGTIEAPDQPDTSQASGASAESAAAGSEAPAETAGGASEAEAEASSQGMKMNLVLGRLASGDRAPISDLASELQMPMLEAATLLGKLSASGLVVIEGEPGREFVSLTDAGRTVAEIAAS